MDYKLQKDLKYYLALTRFKHVGTVTAKKLIGYCGGAKAIFDLRRKQDFVAIPDIGEVLATKILEEIDKKEEYLEWAETELEFIEAHGIEVLTFHNEDYPRRLKHCSDSPLLLMKKGKVDLNNERVISIVGTRNATDYGKGFLDELISDLKEFNPLVVSGLAYGVDIYAHKKCLEHDIPTLAVLGHGFHTIYPGVHKAVSERMCENGGLLTEFFSHSKFEKENFPMRNRIVAGMTDVTIVVESAKKGGSIITAELANSYSRDVMALPGDYTRQYSEGCNHLIKNNKAAVIESVDDMVRLMNWDVKIENAKRQIQRELFVDLVGDEQKIVDVFQQSPKLPIDEISNQTEIPVSSVSTTLLNLEFKGLIKSLPGKVYELVR